MLLSETSMSESARILVIDDDENIRKGLTMILESKGYAVDLATDGAEAIRKSRERFYNVSLIDIRLPDMDGVELLRAMREGVPKMVKIIVTGYPSQENAIKAVNDGANGYIIKPVKTEELLSLIEKHLKKQQDERKYSEEKVAEYIETRAREQEARHSDT